MKIKSFSHVGITVKDFKSAVGWYHRAFGFKLIDEQYIDEKKADELSELYGVKGTSIHLGFLRTPKGGVIEIFEFSNKSEKVKLNWSKPGVTHLTLNVNNVGQWHKVLSEKGIKFLCKPQYTGRIEWVFLEDLDGNLIELIDLKENRFIIKLIGGIVGTIMKKSKFKHYY